MSNSFQYICMYMFVFIHMYVYVLKCFWVVVVVVVVIKCINSGLGFLNSTQLNSTCVTCTRKHVKSFALIDMRYIWCDVIVSVGDCVVDEDDVADDDDFVVPFLCFHSVSHDFFYVLFHSLFNILYVF